MIFSLRLLATIVTASLVLPAAALAHDLSGDAAVTTHMTPQGYEPKDVTVKQGETVAFENTSSVELWPASNIHPTHEIYADFDPKRPVAPGETWTFIFDQAGEWRYHDHLYPTVTGTITVTPVATLLEREESTAAPTAAKVKEGLLARIVASVTTALRELFDPNKWAVASKTQAVTSAHAYDASIAAADESVFSDYERLYSYVKKFGPARTIQHLNALSSRLGSCHDAAHRVGRFAFEIAGNEAFQTCSAECHSGCYHGATEQYFKLNGTAALNESLPTICSFSTNDFYSHQCFHGIGHGLMAWASYELPAALKNCDILESPTSRESCYTGVFMENVVGTLGEGSEAGHSTNYLSDDPHFPCSIVDDTYKGACYFFQTSRMMRLLNNDFARIAAACIEAPANFQGHCFGSMGRDVGGVHRGDPAGAIAACRQAPAGSDRNDCLAGAVQNTFWDPSGQEEALAFCALLSEQTEKDRCYSTIFERALDVLATAGEKRAFCAKASGEYHARCLALVR